MTFNNPGRAARNRRPGTHKRRSHKMKDIIHHFYADGDATDLTLCLVGLGMEIRSELRALVDNTEGSEGANG